MHTNTHTRTWYTYIRNLGTSTSSIMSVSSHIAFRNKYNTTTTHNYPGFLSKTIKCVCFPANLGSQ